jgi:methylmalonyl-CoA/ethylmalonyl-CoA epimerase
MDSPPSSHLKMYPYPVDHIGIAVPDLESGSRPYLMIGLAPLPDEYIASQQVVVRAFWAGESLIELLAPTDSNSPIAGFLEKRGAGLHHIALRVNDLPAEIARLETEGAQFVSNQPRVGRAGTQVVFLHPKWGAGTLIELVEHSTP